MSIFFHNFKQFFDKFESNMQTKIFYTGIQ